MTTLERCRLTPSESTSVLTRIRKSLRGRRWFASKFAITLWCVSSSDWPMNTMTLGSTSSLIWSARCSAVSLDSVKMMSLDFSSNLSERSLSLNACHLGSRRSLAHSRAMFRRICKSLSRSRMNSALKSFASSLSALSWVSRSSMGAWLSCSNKSKILLMYFLLM